MMAEADDKGHDKGHDKVTPPEGQLPSNSRETAASASREAPAADTRLAEVSEAMRLAEEAVSNAVQGMTQNDNKQ
jgi:hypothetical protein